MKSRDPGSIAAVPLRSRVRWFDLYGEPLLLILAIVSVVLVFSVVLRPVEISKADFYIFWDAGRAYNLGLDPYFGIPLRPDAAYNLNAPAVTVALFAPLAWLPLPIAFAVWTVAGVLACLLASVWIARAIGAPGRWLLIASVVLTSQATFLALQFGQPIGPLLLVLTAAWTADRSDRPLTAGFLLGIAIYAKPFFGVFIPYLLWRRSWRLLAALTVSGAAMGIVGLMSAGVSAYQSWLMVLRTVSWEAHLANASLLGVVKRLLTRPPLDLHVTPIALVAAAWIRPLWLMVAAIPVGISVRHLSRHRRIDNDWAVLVLLALLLSPIGWVYYVPLAAGPLIASFVVAPRSARIVAIVGYLCLCMPLTPMMSATLGVTATITLGCVYSWGVMALWYSAVHGAPTTAGTEMRSAAHAL